MIRDRLGRLGKGNIANVSFISVVCASVFAAGLFIANSQPWGYVSPPALSTTNFSRGNAVAYTPWFETGSSDKGCPQLGLCVGNPNTD